MICPQCRNELPEGSKFCNECGRKLEVGCPECGKSNPPGSKFCLECGHDLRKPKEAPPIDYQQPRSYTPKHLADKILSNRIAIEGERKLVTILFADVANSTAIFENLDPEQVHEIMDGCFRIVMDEIHRYEGTINQFTGDGVMALFGAPIAHEDHAQRACYASLAIQESLRPYAERLKRDYGIHFTMRVGLNSGSVVVGAIGDDLRMDYTAQGDTANLAARMESNAQPGNVLVSDHTYRLAKGYFDFDSPSEIQVKGKAEPVKAYQLVKPSKVATRIEASAAKGLTRFVGRGREFETLKDTFEKTRSGEGQVVGVVGEAGVGKSRLLLEFRNSLPKGEYIYLEGRCLHYGSSMPYLPILDAFRTYLGIKEGEKESVIRQKMMQRIVGSDENLTRCLPPIQELFSVKVDEEEFINLEPKQKREKTFEAIRDILIRGSQTRPIVMAIEDLHWIDKTTEEFLDYMIGWLPGSRILLILLYRPEYKHQWGSKSYYSKVGVGQLSSNTSAELVQAILEGGAVAPELRDLILSRAAGNPLFMEELTYSLVENGSVKKKGDKFILTRTVSDIQVPDTIQGIIAARMDRLEDSLKRIMQVASVIGREFAFRILQAITEMKEDLKCRLLNLQGLEFIYEKSLFPELEYIFRHALTQEVAYNSLLVKRRKEIHERIGIAIEELYPDRLEEFYEMLAYHYSASENLQKAIQYWQLAAKRALLLYAVNEAIEYLTRALQKTEELPAREAKNDVKLEVGTKLAFAHLLRNDIRKAIDIVRPLEVLATEDRHLKELGRIYATKGLSLMWLELDIRNAIEYFRKAIRIGWQATDLPTVSYSTIYSSVVYIYWGNFDLAKEAASELITILLEKESWYTLCVPYFTLAFISCYQADAENVEKWTGEAYECGEKVVDPYPQIWVNLAEGLFQLERGAFDQAEARLIKAMGHAEGVSEHMGLGNSLELLAILHIRKGQYDAALGHVQELRSLAERSGIAMLLCPCFHLEAEIYLHLSQPDKTLKCLEEGLKYEVPFWQGRLYRIYGDYYRATSPIDFQASEAWYQKAIDVHERIGMKLELARDYVSYGRLLQRKADGKEAADFYQRALGIFTQFGAEWDIQIVEEDMSGLQMHTVR